jgi:nucleotide-binding universal stress UspA family protein
MDIQKILVPTDFSEQASQATAYAANLARAVGATLHVVHACVPLHEVIHEPADRSPDRETLEQMVRDQSDKKLADLQAPAGVPLVVESVQGYSVGPAVVDHASAIGADLIVMGTHGRSGVSRLLLGSVAEQVVQHAPCSVVAMRQLEKGATATAPASLLVALDFSEESAKALAWAGKWAAKLGASLLVTHVIEEVPHPAFYLFGNDSVVDMFPDLVKRVRASLDKLVETHVPDGVDVETIIAEGKSHVKVVELAREHNIELVVMGTHGLSGVERLVVGSATAKVLRSARCPVAAVRDKKSSPRPLQPTS